MATKLILCGALCIHWFNPLVFVMYSLFNRDLEISCDDEVVRHFGENEKSGYARALISMEEKKAGLTPLYNGFSKNAIEERIGAVMKNKKTSIIALLTTVILVSGVLLGFATTAKEKNVNQRDYLEEILYEVLEDSFSEKECEMLADLWVNGYEDMTVSEYQEKLWTMTDTVEYMELIERFSQTEYVCEADEKVGKTLEQYSQYFHYVFEPLCAEKWMKRKFGGAFVCDGGNVYAVPVPNYLSRQENALLEYNLTLYIKQPKQLTVGQYRDAHLQTVDDISAALKERTEAELADGQLMEKILNTEIDRIISDRSDEKLSIAIDYGFQSMDYDSLMLGYGDEDWTEEQIQEQKELKELSIEETRQEMESVLRIYQEYGLTWEIIPSESFFNCDVDVHMYWQGNEVRGIYDSERKVWITYWAGNSRYSSDTVDLYVVYKDGEVSGLRKATEKEALYWTELREQNMEEQALSQEEDRHPSATKADYDSLLELMSPNYKKMSVAAFGDKLLNWCNEDHDRSERISEDSAQGIWRETLSDEERSFVELTFGLSGEENHRLINNLRDRSPQEEKDIRYGGISHNCYKESEEGMAFVDCWYCFYWYIADRESLTVGERDLAIQGFMNEAEQKIQSMDLDELLVIEESELVSILKETAQKYSNASGGLLKIEIEEDDVSIDRLDERELMREVE